MHLQCTSLLFIALQAAASQSTIAAALAQCERVVKLTWNGVMTLVKVTSFATACTAGVSSPEVAHAMCRTVVKIDSSSYGQANLATCRIAGVIPAVVASMTAHGSVNRDIAVAGCEALSYLAYRDTCIAESLVMPDGGLEVIISIMSTYVGDLGAQWRGCAALSAIAKSCGPDALSKMRESAAIDLLLAAKRDQPKDYRVDSSVREALARLDPEVCRGWSSPLGSPTCCDTDSPIPIGTPPGPDELELNWQREQKPWY